MEFNVIKNKLARGKISTSEIDGAVDEIILNSLAFTYANESLENVEVYLVFKRTGGFRSFKTINGHIISDKLDYSYLESRELVCLPAWNVKKAYKVKFNSDNNLTITEVDWKEIHLVLFSTVEPTTVKYAIGLEDEGIPSTVTVDYSSYKGLSYNELRNCVESSYLRNLKIQGVTDTVVSLPSCYVVSYAIAN